MLSPLPGAPVGAEFTAGGLVKPERASKLGEKTVVLSPATGGIDGIDRDE